MPKLVAWKVVELNDLELDYHYEIADGPTLHRYHGAGVPIRVPYTPEERYDAVLKWVRENLT